MGAGGFSCAVSGCGLCVPSASFSLRGVLVASAGRFRRTLARKKPMVPRVRWDR